MTNRAQEYWDKKHPKMWKTYNGRILPKSKTQIPVDVRHFITGDDVVLKQLLIDEIYKDGAQQHQTSFDDLAWFIQRYVVETIKYVGDDETSGCPEFWQFPCETVVTGTGDCEDGSFLMASLMLHAGIPSWRVRVAAGWVKAGEGAAQGGHAYVCYCRETDNEWVVCDWCYLEDSGVPVPRKKLLNMRPEYREVWFSMNDQHCYAHKDFKLNARIKETSDVD